MLIKIKTNSAFAYRLLAAVCALTMVFAMSMTQYAFAAPNTASLELGDSRPNQTSTYNFSVSNLNTGQNIACVEIDLGTNADGTGAISGLNTSSSTLNSNSIVSGTTVSNTQSANHVLRATKATPSAPSASGSVVFGAVTNGSTADTSYFAVFTTYSDQACTTSVESITVQFIYTNGQTVTVTVDPSFTFSVNAVTAGTGAQAVNGQDTTVTTTATTIPFGTTSASGNEVGAQDLQISTNAQGGYNIYMRQTGPLTNASSDTINAVSGSNACTYAAPASFPAAGTEAFGFTTNDADISSGNYAANNWCDVTGTNQSVGSGSVATSGTQTVRVGYQVGVSTTTEAGNYSNTIIYTAVPTY